MSALDFAGNAGWAMTREACNELALIADRANDASPQILEAYRAQSLERAERAKARDGVAILDVKGPLFKRANLFVAMSGATSYEILRKDLQVALDDNEIHSIAILVDSPGGEANGCDELAAAIFAGRKVKPITAYVSGMACSGGYWIAAAASKVVVSDAALLGSIGVVLGVQDTSAAEEKRGVKTHQFVSSQSPGKRPDVNSEAGQSQIQKMVDDLADVFVSAVAKYRGVSIETVITKFGAGGVEVGKNAVAAGMADEVGSFEGVVSSLVKSGNKGRIPTRSGGFIVSEENTGPTAAEITATATKATQTRIKTIVTSENGKALATLAAHLAYETEMTAEASVAILGAARADFDAKPAATAEGAEGDKPGADTFIERKSQAGSLGLAQPEAAGGNKPDPMAGWGTAIKSANANLGIN